MNPRHTRFVAALIAALLFIPTGTALGQENTAKFQLDKLEPLPAQGVNIVNTATSDVVGHLSPSAGLFIHYQHAPLKLENKEKSLNLLNYQIRGEISLAMGFFDIVDLGIVMPLVLHQKGKYAKDDQWKTSVEDYFSDASTLENLKGFVAGDLRIIPKVKIIDPSWAAGFGLGLQATVYVPIQKTPYNSYSNVAVEPRLILDYRHDIGINVAANIAYNIKTKKNKHLYDYIAQDALRWNLALRTKLGLDWLYGFGALFGEFQVANSDIVKSLKSQLNKEDLDPPTSPHEWYAGLEFRMPYNLIAQIGGGGSLTKGQVGAPWMRFFGSLGYTPLAKDTDGDGVMDGDDICPNEPGPVENQGCPWGDRDLDGIMDDRDNCPDEPGPEENNGCPWGDTDGDGVNDGDDKCPNEPGPAENQGCPWGDSDGDGVNDGDDKCPKVPGPVENQGCPWGDSDGDGVNDNIDKCPNEPGPAQNDGCPWPDTDGDGIPDHLDQCPKEAGPASNKGCPGKSKVRISETKIEILEKVFFQTGKSKIQKRSFDLLNQVANVLQSYDRITKVRIEGHTDSVGNDRKNQRLSQQRAEAVKTYLIEAGVDPGRLDAVGYGEDNPIDTNKTKAGRERNRRVEFTITELDGRAVDAKSITIKEKVTE